MKLEIEDRNDMRIVKISEDRVDAAVAIQFKDSMAEATKDGPDRVVLDMSQVKFLDSSGLGAVVATMKLLGNERKLELAGLTPTVEKVFRLTRMDSIFAIHESVAAIPEST